MKVFNIIRVVKVQNFEKIKKAARGQLLVNSIFCAT